MAQTGTDPYLDVKGESYTVVLRKLHEHLRPQTYLEVGSLSGGTLRLASARTIAVDPQFKVESNVIGNKPMLLAYQMTSDAFFRSHNPTALLGAEIDLAFLDGMHLFEFLLRDFMNTERYCRPNSVIALHDCLPGDPFVATRSAGDPLRNRSSRPDWWTGDVWKIVPCLRRFRPDLKIVVIDAAPTGLVLITNLDKSSTVLRDRYHEVAEQFVDLNLDEHGVANLREGIVPTSELTAPDNLSKLFWL